MTPTRKCTIWGLILLILVIWTYSPILFPATVEGDEDGFTSMYSPDRKYKVALIEPGLYTPWAFWQALTNECIMFVRLYDNTTGELLGQSSWFNYMDCFDWGGIFIWPYELGPDSNVFRMGYPSFGPHSGVLIEIE